MASRPVAIRAVAVPAGSRRPELLALITLTTLYLVTRLTNLLVLPIFADEGTYLRYADLFAHALRRMAFVSIERDGKPPLFVWVVGALLRISRGDPLLIGRLVSVAAGLLTLVIIYLLARELFSPRAGALAAGLHLVNPLAFSMERMALHDSLLTAACTATLYGCVLLARRPGWRTSVFLGAAVGAGLLTKNTAAFLPYLAPPAVWLARSRSVSGWCRRALLALIGAYLVAQALYLPVRLQPTFGRLAAREQGEYLFSLRELLELPWDRWLFNLSEVAHWGLAYLGVPLLVLLVLSAVTLAARAPRRTILLAGWFGIPLAAEVILAKEWFFARYLLPFLPALFVLIGGALAGWAAWLGDRIRSRRVATLLVAACLLLALLPNLRFDYWLLAGPAAAPYPATDRWQYVEGWPSGYGIAGILGRVRAEAGRRPVVLFLDDLSLGVPEDSFQAYLEHLYPRVVVKHLVEHRVYVRELGQERFTLLVSTRDPPPSLDATPHLLLTGSKPGSNLTYYLYRLRP